MRQPFAQAPALRPGPATAVLAAALLALAVGLPERPAAAGEEVTVSIDNFTFSPAEVTVVPGTTVTWVNNDDIPHTVVEKTQAFRSKVIDTEGKFSFTFMTVGDFTYFCSLHPHMTGKVVVKPAG